MSILLELIDVLNSGTELKEHHSLRRANVKWRAKNEK